MCLKAHFCHPRPVKGEFTRPGRGRNNFDLYEIKNPLKMDFRKSRRSREKSPRLSDFPSPNFAKFAKSANPDQTLVKTTRSPAILVTELGSSGPPSSRPRPERISPNGEILSPRPRPLPGSGRGLEANPPKGEAWLSCEPKYI